MHKIETIFEQMGELDRHGNITPRTPTGSPRTIEQLLRGEASRWSPLSSPTFAHHDAEDDHGHHHKKSVLAKVKERAKKWRNSLGKKKHSDEDNTTPSWGVSLDDDDDDEEGDPEYLGAPMYESELASDVYKEKARQHPRADPVLSENHILATNVVEEKKMTDEKLPSPSNVKSITETVSEKLAPAYATLTVATNAITTKIQGLASPIRAKPKLTTSASAPVNGKLKESAGFGFSTSSEQIWDKGVSMKEYLMHKFEPGEDERALSSVISEAMSPRKSTAGSSSVVEKVREAVSSLLRNDETTNPQSTMAVKSVTNLPSITVPTAAATTTSSSHSSSTSIPISTNAHEVVVKETLGRILQIN